MPMKREEKIQGVTQEGIKITLDAFLEETVDPPKGEIFIKLLGPEGKFIFDQHFTNLVVNSCGVLLAELMKNDGPPGTTHLALGSGDPGWNPLSPPSPNRGITQLETEIIRKPWDSTGFVDQNGNPSTSPTNRVDFNFSFGVGEGDGSLMEMGLFGGIGAGVTNGGLMVNVFRMPVVSKLLGFSLLVTWRLTFG